MKRWLVPGPGAIAFLAVWLLLLAGGRSNFLRDPGTFWHIATGERILANGFLRADPYTFTFAGTWWVPYQWLGEVVMALVHRVGGFDALLLGSVTLIAAVFAWLAVRLNRTGLHPVAVGLVVFLAIAASSTHFHVRPLLFTIAGMALTMCLLLDVEAGRTSLARLWWLVPFYAAWVNVHGGVLGGMATLVLTAAGWVAFRRLGRPSPLAKPRDELLALAIAAACCLTAFVNPYGLDLLRTWHVIMGEPLLKQIIQEHSPLVLSEAAAWPILAFAAFHVFLLAGVPIREWRVTWLLPAVWFVLTLDRVRHAPLFAVLALASLAAIWPHTRWARRLAERRPDFYQPRDATSGSGMGNLLLPVAAVLLAFTLQLAKVEAPLIGAKWARHDSRDWPVELLDVLKQNEPRDDHNHIFNDYIDGGFIIYHTPGYKVFVDDRCEVFGGAWLVDFVRAGSQDTAGAIARWEARYGRFDFALTRADTGFETYFASSPEWECVKRAPTAAFYRRK